MALTYYLNSLNNGIREQPNEYYRGLQQAFYDAQWENTTARIEVQMQDGIGASTYSPIEVWINKVIGNTTTFMKNGEDYRQLVFRNIDQECGRGYMFLFDDSYWLADFWNPSQGVAADILVRRCNNSLNIVDPENGAIFSIPCVVDYDLTSPTMLINSSILTPNSHAIVYVQANDDTLRLFKLNKRFLLNGRPFKLYAYQNLLNRSLNLPQPPVLYLDLYLDELHAKDNIETNVADNGDYVYTISINADSMNLISGSTGRLTSTILLNGVETERPIVWSSNNPDIVNIKDSGEYQVLGTVGQTALVSAGLVGNPDVSAQIEFTIVDISDVKPIITLDPSFVKIRQYETITSNIQVEYGGSFYIPTENEIHVTLGPGASKYLSAQVIGNKLSVTCVAIAMEPQTFTIATDTYNASQTFQVDCVSMLG